MEQRSSISIAFRDPEKFNFVVKVVTAMEYNQPANCLEQ